MNVSKRGSELNQLTNLLEAHLNWGPISQWTTLDFEKLADLIRDKTDISLSVTTLKRILGRLKYNSKPAPTTLSTLAKFMDFNDWRDFEKSLQPPVQHQVKDKAAPARLPDVKPVFLIAIAIIILASFFWGGVEIDPAQFKFEANKILSEGVPNSVIFTYDATAAPTDSIYIVQTWDVSRRILVPRDGHAHSAIYYWPGFFRTKLMIGDEIVRTHDLQITSDGWLVIAEQMEKPLYFDKSDFLSRGLVEISEDDLNRYEISSLPEAPRLRFFNQGDFGSLMNDAFVFQTTFKSMHASGNSPCQFTQILIQCKDDVMIFPFSALPCVGDLSLYAAGASFQSQHADLSGFGTDLTSWTTLRVESKNRHMTIWVDGEKVVDFTFPHFPTGIVGLQYRFFGPASIKEAWFTNEIQTWDLFAESHDVTVGM